MKTATESKMNDAFPSYDAEKDTIVYHAPCFDGLISTVVARDYLENSRGWEISNFIPVKYNLPETWLDEPLPGRNAAIVDFLYHPKAKFWVDHHGTTFLDEKPGGKPSKARADYEASVHLNSRTLIYDKTSPSGALLLWNHVKHEVSDHERFAEMVTWANRTDSANYENAEQGVFGDEPALRIATALGSGTKIEPEHLRNIIDALKVGTLAEVAALTMVLDRFIAAREKNEKGLEVIRKRMRVSDDGLGVYEADAADGVTLPRYGPFLLHPEIRYMLSLVHGEEGAKISASRNPWGPPTNAPLGQIFSGKNMEGKYRGGGHHPVGAVLIPKDLGREHAREVFREILVEIREAERKHAVGLGR